MNNYLETEAKNLFSKLKVRYIILEFFLLLFGISFGLGNIIGVVALIIAIFHPPFGELFFENNKFMEGFIDENIFFIGVILYVVLFPLICWLILRKMKLKKIKLKSILGRFSLKKRLWLSVFIVILAERIIGYGITYLTLFFASLISQDFAKNAVESANESFTYNGASLFLQIIYWLLLFIMAVIVAPITEEFIFRGAILHRWATKWGIFAGVLTSSFLFGIVHLNIFFISISVGGIIYALLYIKTGSLLVPIIAHALNNLLVFVDLFLKDILSIPSSNEEITIMYLWYGIVNIILAIPALIYFLTMPKNIADLPYFANEKRNQKVSIEDSLTVDRSLNVKPKPTIL